MKYGPWVTLIWLGVGVAVVAWLTLARPDRVCAFGSILGEGEAPTPTADTEAGPVRP